MYYPLFKIIQFVGLGLIAAGLVGWNTGKISYNVFLVGLGIGLFAWGAYKATKAIRK